MRRTTSVLCAVVLSGVVLPAAAFAQSAPDAAAVAKAKKLFAEGSSLYLAGEYGQALEALTASYNLVPSPNSELVVARCLRELGRRVEAQESFATAELEARHRAAEGAPKYAQTADTAAAEGAAVRSALGTIRIRIEAAEPETKLEVDRVPRPIPAGGEAVVWHEPGEAMVSVVSPSGLEQKQVVTVRAGAEVTMGFGHPELPPTPEPQTAPAGPAIGPTPPLVAPPDRRPEQATPAASHASAAWAKPAAYVSGGVALAGAGLFTGFGLAADSTYRSLKAHCPSGCTSSDRNKATLGSTYEHVANISLVAGSVAAAATITFAIVAATHPASGRSGGRLRWHLLVGPIGLGAAGEFQ